MTLFRCSYTPVFTLYMDVSHILVMFVHHGSVDFRQGIGIEPGTEIVMALWVFFFSVQTSWFVYQYKTTSKGNYSRA